MTVKAEYIRVCAWCRKVISPHARRMTEDEIAAFEKQGLVSHGVCVDCSKKLQAEVLGSLI